MTGAPVAGGPVIDVLVVEDDPVAADAHALYVSRAPGFRCVGTAHSAAEALRLTAKDLKRLGVIDDVIPEPLGGAHRDPREMGATLKTFLLRYLRELSHVPVADLLDRRYDKFRAMGVFDDGPSGEGVSVNGVAAP